MSWRGEAGGIEAAKQGHNVVMSPTTYCYFDYYQSSHDGEPLAIGGYLPLEKVYKYDPVPAELTKEQEKYILGGQANLWTEYMTSMEHVEYMAFPRALALIQSLWCTNKPDYKTFLTTYLKSHEDYLGLHDANYAKSIHYPDLIIERAAHGINIMFVGTESTEEYALQTVFQDNNIYEHQGERIITRDTLNHNSQPGNVGKRGVYYTLKSESFDGTLHYSFNLSGDLGREIELVTPPHPKYDHNGSLNLVDGISGGERFKGNEWLGFRDDQIEMIIDTRNSEALSGFKIGLKENNGSWIYLPKRIRIFASEDGENWVELTDSKKLVDGENLIPFDEITTNYIKIELETIGTIPEGMGGAGNMPWTFIDEIEFIRK